MTSSESDKSSILLLRLQTMSGSYLWVHTVLQLKDGVEEGAAPVIILTNQILSTEEAAVMKANSWLYHYYMVQSRLQYGLAYGAHSPALGALYYPHMQTSPWETPSPHYPSSHYSPTLPYSTPYLYSPAPHYSLPHSEHPPMDRAPEATAPLDFSHPASRGDFSQQSSPSLRSDTSSSPVYQPNNSESLYGPEVGLLAQPRHAR